MSKMDDLRAQREELVAKGRELAERGEELDEAGTKQLMESAEALRKLDEQLDEAEKVEQAAKVFAEARTGPAGDDPRMRSGLPISAQGRPNDAQLEEIAKMSASPGELFTRSTAYRDWLTQFPQGGPPNAMSVYSNVEDVQGPQYRNALGLRSATEKWRGGVIDPVKARTLVTSADASAGLWVRPEYRGLLEPGLVRPLTVRQLVTVLPTASDAIEYIKEATRVSAAAPVTEAAQLLNSGDTTATKPEGGLTFSAVTDVVRQIALWVPATRRIMADAPQLMNYINSYLTDDIGLELEDQIVSGTGAPGFTGIFNTSGTQTLGPPAGGLTELDLIRRAKRLIVTNARTNATAVLANPEDTERWAFLKATDNRYIFSDPTAGANNITNVWGIPVVESEACPTGFALVGDFRRAILFDRESVQISVGTANEDFIRNIVRVLAEMRAGFGVTRPSAFVEVDLLV